MYSNTSVFPRCGGKQALWIIVEKEQGWKRNRREGFPYTPQCDVAESPQFLSSSASLSTTECVFWVSTRENRKMLQRWLGGGWWLSLGNHRTKRRRQRKIRKNRKVRSWLVPYSMYACTNVSLRSVDTLQYFWLRESPRHGASQFGLWSIP